MAPKPTPSRPRFPGYGIAEEAEAMFSWDWALERLGGSRNYWISTTHRDGRPHAMPVWGVVVDGTLYFGTSDTSAKGRNLARSPEVVAHTESGDETVILEGVVETVAVTEEIAAAYDSKYDWQPDLGERYLAVRPRRAFAWRERDYPTSATRFDF